jgi:hypothetical protein
MDKYKEIINNLNYAASCMPTSLPVSYLQTFVTHCEHEMTMEHGTAHTKQHCSESTTA